MHLSTHPPPTKIFYTKCILLTYCIKNCNAFFHQKSKLPRNKLPFDLEKSETKMSKIRNLRLAVFWGKSSPTPAECQSSWDRPAGRGRPGCTEWPRCCPRPRRWRTPGGCSSRCSCPASRSRCTFAGRTAAGYRWRPWSRPWMSRRLRARARRSRWPWRWRRRFCRRRLRGQTLCWWTVRRSPRQPWIWYLKIKTRFKGADIKIKFNYIFK